MLKSFKNKIQSSINKVGKIIGLIIFCFTISLINYLIYYFTLTDVFNLTITNFIGIYLILVFTIVFTKIFTSNDK